MSESCRIAALRWPITILMAMTLLGCLDGIRRTALDPTQVDVRVVDRAGYNALLAEKRGKVVVVDFWASWCDSCVANFPHMVELAQRLGEQGVDLVTVNFDAPEAADKTLEFLKERRAGAAANLISRYGGSSKSMEEFEIPNGAIPCYKLYDRKGRLRQTFAVDPAVEKQFTLQEINAAVEQLLAE